MLLGLKSYNYLNIKQISKLIYNELKKLSGQKDQNSKLAQTVVRQKVTPIAKNRNVKFTELFF